MVFVVWAVVLFRVSLDARLRPVVLAVYITVPNWFFAGNSSGASRLGSGCVASVGSVGDSLTQASEPLVSASLSASLSAPLSAPLFDAALSISAYWVRNRRMIACSMRP